MFVKRGLRAIRGKWTISRKLMTAFSIASALLLGVSGLSMVVVSHLNANIGTVDRDYLPMIESLGTTNANILQLKGILQNHIIEQDPSRKADNETKLRSLLDKINRENADLKGKIAADDTIKQKLLQAYRNAFDSYTKDLNQVLADSRTNDTAKAINDLNNIETEYYQSSYNLSKLIDLYNLEINGGAQDASKYAASTFDIVIAVSLAAILFMIASGWLIARSISRPVKKLEAQVQRVAEGDLTVEAFRIDTRDEVGNLSRDFDTMIGNLKTIVAAIVDGANLVATASGQIAAGYEEVNKASGTITDSVDAVSKDADAQYRRSRDVAAAIGGIAEGMERVARAIASVAELSASANRNAEAGSSDAKTAVERIREAQEKVDVAADKVGMLERMSGEIGRIMAVVSDIAEQTNLLSLNASIEAARAGEHGRGFHVVAGEIRKLSEQVKRSSDEVGLVVRNIRDEVAIATASVQEGKSSLTLGVDQVNRMDEAFLRIVRMIRDVSERTREVTAVVGEVSARSEELVQSAGEMADISQNTADRIQHVAASVEEQTATMEEIAAASEDLGKTAAALQESVRQFKTI